MCFAISFASDTRKEPFEDRWQREQAGFRDMPLDREFLGFGACIAGVLLVSAKLSVDLSDYIPAFWCLIASDALDRQ